ncbi:hypothetical protein H0H81_012139, partial [Sphagnurus paluster]
MPTISVGDKVLVSGANGFIAIWVVRKLLEKGYRVRGTVRSADKVKFLEESFKSYGGKFEVFIVKDITKEGAFDEAVNGVDVIAHIASPVHTNVISPNELIKPAVNGTIGILKSAVKNGNSVKRIVVTSSCGAVLEVGVDKVFSEVDWNEPSIREVEEQGDNAPPASKYRASKTLAEKAAWEFYEKNKAEIKWDLAVLHPPYVFGPVIHDVKDPASLNITMRMWYDAVLMDGKSKDFLTTQGSAYIDVRDAAESHILAMEKQAAGGERIIISTGPFVWQDWIDTARALVPSTIPSHTTLPLGYPGAPSKLAFKYDASKATRILGLKYRSKGELTRDTLADFEEHSDIISLLQVSVPIAYFHPMANLDDLPAEIRTTIVGLAMKTYVTDGEYATERQKFRFACNLSLVSRAMNETAGPFIFRKYRLDIRQNEYDWRKTIYPPRSERMRWDEDLIAQRLAHLRSKAEHVRVIVLKDYGPERDKKEAENDPPPFPPQLMPSLMAALHTLRYVTGVSLITGSFDSGQAVFLPHELWHWIHTVHPVEFAIQGDFKITPEILTPTLESVTALKAAQNATRVTLHSMWGALCLIKPVNPRLGSIDISLEISSYNLRAPLFDFSAVPQAQVNVELFFSRSGESQLQISVSVPTPSAQVF